MDDKALDQIEARVTRHIPTAEDVARAVMAHLTGDKVIENIPLVPGQKLQPWTFGGQAAADDKKNDQLLEAVANLTNQVKALSTTVAKSTKPGA